MNQTAAAGDQWLRWITTERGLLSSTVKAYQRELRALWHHSHGDLVSLNTQDLRNYLTSAGGGPSTVANRIAALRSFYSFLVRAELRADDPTMRLDRPKQRKGLPKPVDDPKAVLEQLHERGRLVATLLHETGLRISEACALTVPTPAPEQIIVRGKGSKERIVLLTDRARDALNALGGRIDARPRTVQRWMQKAGVTPHRWRHTFACDLARTGADLGDIQELLGHASPATSKVYARFGLDRLRKANERRALLSHAADTLDGTHDSRTTAPKALDQRKHNPVT